MPDDFEYISRTRLEYRDGMGCDRGDVGRDRRHGRSHARLSRRLGVIGRRLGALTLAAAVALVAPGGADAVRPGQPAPEIAGGSWINSAPLTTDGLRGRVVLVEFWTYG